MYFFRCLFVLKYVSCHKSKQTVLLCITLFPDDYSYDDVCYFDIFLFIMVLSHHVVVVFLYKIPVYCCVLIMDF